ncbi:hypothetical protein SteCoe_31316 [Stentor coeruleus]|uniref:Uncharacterized protein n=1 Tax=Stentor coeruleus TaxID=5963 RepID=A0A1R2B1N5_9CILI|nr:hypothetical protein SteCoe_31316 [Stentor coeruleus]
MNNSQEIQSSNPRRGFEPFIETIIEIPDHIIVPKPIRNSIEPKIETKTNFFKQGLNAFLVTLERKLEIEKTALAMQKSKETSKSLLIKIENLFEYLCGGYMNQPFKLVFHDELPFPAYKDKFFTLRGNIVDRNNKIISLNEPMLFSAVLYGANYPIKIIERTKHNDKILVGNSVVETINSINFRRIAVKEVSSFHPSKMFNLAVVPEDMKLVQPFIFPGLVVKSSKLRPGELRKKFKVDKLMNQFENS